MSDYKFGKGRPASVPTKVDDLVSTASAGAKPTPDGAVSVNFTTPTVNELGEYCVELEAKLNEALAAMRAHGLLTET